LWRFASISSPPPPRSLLQSLQLALDRYPFSLTEKAKRIMRTVHVSERASWRLSCKRWLTRAQGEIKAGAYKLRHAPVPSAAPQLVRHREMDSLLGELATRIGVGGGGGGGGGGAGAALLSEMATRLLMSPVTPRKSGGSGGGDSAATPKGDDDSTPSAKKRRKSVTASPVRPTKLSKKDKRSLKGK
jgi:hypothetical protein